MGYFLTTSSDRPPARSHVGPKTHTPGLQVQERGLRFYSPGLGRWASRDPADEQAGLDLYSFVNNRPIHDKDYFGLWSELQRTSTERYWKVSAQSDNESVSSLISLLNGTKLYLDGGKALGSSGWLRNAADGSSVDRIRSGCRYRGPNTAYITYGDMNSPDGGPFQWIFSRALMAASRQMGDALKGIGFFVKDLNGGFSSPNGETWDYINFYLNQDDVAAWIHVGHGKTPTGELMLYSETGSVSGNSAATFTPKWPLSHVLLWSCYAGNQNWSSLMAPGGKLYAVSRALTVTVDMPFGLDFPYGTVVVWSPP